MRSDTLTILLAVLIGATSTARAGAEPAPEARRYRDATKHTPVSVRSGGHGLVWENKPTLYRIYAGVPTIPLPPPRLLAAPALAVVGRGPLTPSARTPVDLPLLSAMLFLSGGITHRLEATGREIRATAAAGALYPNETYIVTGAIGDLPAGVYHYDPLHNRLSQLRTGDYRAALAGAAVDDRVRTAPATLVVSGILWRSAWKYRERGYRHLYWDGGMQVAHIVAAAAAAHVPAFVMAGFVDREVDRLLGLDGTREAALALVAIGEEASAPPPVPPPGETAEIAPLQVSTTALSPHPIDYAAALRYHAATVLADAAAVRRYRAAQVRGSTPDADATRYPLPAPAPARGDPSLDAVVRRRRSTRTFARHPMAAAELAAVLDAPLAALAADVQLAALLHTYVVVNAVRDLAPGAYVFQSATRELEQLKSGNFRTMAAFLSLQQDLAHDASAVLYYLADLSAISAAFGERGYRTAELAAGIAAGRAYLAAYAVGRGASGLTFYDDEVTKFFSPHAAGLEPLLVVTVGVPAKR